MGILLRLDKVDQRAHRGERLLRRTRILLSSCPPSRAIKRQVPTLRTPETPISHYPNFGVENGTVENEDYFAYLKMVKKMLNVGIRFVTRRVGTNSMLCDPMSFQYHIHSSCGMIYYLHYVFLKVE